MSKNPLGLSDRIKLTKDQQKRLDVIDQLDLSVEKRAVLALEACKPRHIDLLEREFKRFLVLALLVKSDDYRLVPSRPRCLMARTDTQHPKVQRVLRQGLWT